VGLVAVGALAAPASAAVGEAPSVRLFAADRSLRVTTDEIAESMNLGLWVASTGGDFVIRAQRPGYGRWEAAQIDAANGAPLRPIPGQLIDGASRLRRFVAVRFLDRTGRVVVRRELPFCPASAERVSPDGPRGPTYSQFCGFGFPFVRGALWGVDRGWAAPAAGLFGFPAISPPGLPERPLRLRPGRYQVRASIRAGYRRLFDVAPDGASARVRVRVVRGRGRPGLPPPPIPATPGPATFERAASIASPPDPATLPDLEALPPWQVITGSRRGRDSLRFAGSPWNAGPGPLLVEGYRRRGRDVMQAVQSFVDGAGNVTASAPAGQMVFHAAPGHNHWHFLQFVTYRIVRPSGGEVVRSRKQAFCLAATDAVDLTVSGAELRPDALGLSASSCGDSGSIWIRETLPAGWGDTYSPFLPGQRFDITHVPNGRYLLEMHVNPRGDLQEVTTANNVAHRRVTLGGRPGRRTVRVARWHGIRD
jgi:hypothetical protein